MSVGTKSYRYLKVFSKSVKTGIGFAQPKPRQLLYLLSTHQLINVRNISTTNNLWTNVSFNLTDIGEGIREVVIKEWYVKIGDRVAQFDNICEVQSDKASVTITSRYDGVISKLYYDVDGIAHVGKPLVDIETEDLEGGDSEVTEKVPDQNTQRSDEKDSAQEHNSKEYKKSLCVPSVRRLSKEHNIDLSKVKGTGKDGRILKEDILSFLQYSQSDPKDITKDVDPIENDRIEKITGFKKVMVKTMTDALKIPHFLYCDEIKITKLNQIRSTVKKELNDINIKLTILPFFIKAVSNALHKHPILNSSLDANCENITYKKAHNIGIAMDTELGLVVPVIKNVDKLSIFEIAKEIERLKASGKKGSFNPSDLNNGTFTISNVGVIGGTYTAPIILSPQVAIVALGVTQVLPRFDSSDNVVQEEILSLSGSADHRIVDGATMARFVTLVKKQIENPYLLFLNM